jgi:hypothetical protein
VWVFPSNEVSLNAVAKVLQNHDLIHSGRIRIPGTAQVDRIYAAAELSNKAIFSSLLTGHDLTSSEALETHLSKWPCNDEVLVKLAELRIRLYSNLPKKMRKTASRKIIPRKYA